MLAISVWRFDDAAVSPAFVPDEGLRVLAATPRVVYEH
jgi:hypothetical protein